MLAVNAKGSYCHGDEARDEVGGEQHFMIIRELKRRDGSAGTDLGSTGLAISPRPAVNGDCNHRPAVEPAKRAWTGPSDSRRWEGAEQRTPRPPAVR